MKITDREDWLELVTLYDAEGTNVYEDLGYEVTDKQREMVACAHRDLRQAESIHGDKEADDFCEEAKNAAVAWMKDFNDAGEATDLYMHVETGSVASYTSWVDDCYLFEEEGFETAKDCVEYYISKNILVRVKKNEKGEWVEV